MVGTLERQGCIPTLERGNDKTTGVTGPYNSYIIFVIVAPIAPTLQRGSDKLFSSALDVLEQAVELYNQYN